MSLFFAQLGAVALAEYLTSIRDRFDDEKR